MTLCDNHIDINPEGDMFEHRADIHFANVNVVSLTVVVQVQPEDWLSIVGPSDSP